MKNILTQQKKIFETKDSKPFASQLYLDISPFFHLFMFFVFIITSLYIVKKKKNKIKIFLYIYQGFKKTFLMLYINIYIYIYTYIYTYILYIYMSKVLLYKKDGKRHYV